MKKRYILAIIVATFLTALIGLVYNLFYTTPHIFTITELKSNSSNIVRVYGFFVKEGSIHFDRNKILLTFDAYDREYPENIIHIIYKRPKPDLLKANQKVIFEGKYNRDENIFNASELLIVHPEPEEIIWRIPTLTKH